MSDEASTLEERVAALEQRVAQLESRPQRANPIPPPPRPRERVRPTPAAADAARQQWFNSGEGWLGRAGVGLVVISFVFLYRYAVERGWLTPALRIALGIVVGAAMLGGGFMYFTDRRRYRQILMGGGVVLLFVTGLAASELYNLVPGIVALIWHTIIAGIAFQIASRQDDPLMASIAAAGALVPPSLLLADEVPGLWLFLYLLVVIPWAALLILTRGWRSLLIVSAACGVAATLYSVRAQDAVANTSAALVVLATWIGFAALPLARQRLGFEAARPLLSPDLRFTLPALAALAAWLFPFAGRVRAPALVPLAHAIAVIVGFEFIALLDRFNREGPFDIFALGFFAVAGLAVLVAHGLQHTNERFIYPCGFAFLGLSYVFRERRRTA